MRRFLLVLAGVLLLLPAAAAALPVYDGGQTFPAIQGPEGPEDYSWEVKFGEGEELKAIDEHHAGVFWEDGTEAMTITAVAAHDAIGTDVPTTLTVTEPNIITLTVHHRDGNPAAGGAPFDYPVTAGEGWEGGLKTEEAIVTEGDQPPAPLTCVVPDLTNRTLRASRKILHRAHCKLGRVRGERRREVRVAQQYRQVGKVLPVWTAVDVKALAPGQYSRNN
ncbi:MAG: hypothetical protein QOF06_436 [Solirubrobacterales bacterium]|jgi:hypothetical protein|nr:hypothetical protein [Solirubrobacterales bacterium]